MDDGCYSSEGAGWASKAAGQALEPAGWALDAPCRASEAVVSVQRQLKKAPEAAGGDFFLGKGGQRVKLLMG